MDYSKCNEDEKAEVQIPPKFIRRLFFTLGNNVEDKNLKSNERLKDTGLTRN